MQKYFYKAPTLLKKALFKQLQLVNLEQEYFRAAILAGLNNNPSIDHNQLYESVINFTLDEQFHYAQSNHLEQIFKQFNVLHRYKRNMPILRNEAIQTIKDLVDPDKFPISDLSYKFPLWRSNWEKVQHKLKKRLGFYLKIKQSTLRHSDSGKGVFLETKGSDDIIQPGTLLGFVPGTIFNCSKEQNTYNNRTKTRVEYIHFTKQKILDLSKIKLEGIKQPLEGRFKNPYAVGQYINHPPPREAANVVFLEIQIPGSFFVKQFLNFLPYQYASRSESEKDYAAFGIFNICPVKNGSELFVNYLDHHIYPIDTIPEWLVQPAPLPPILQKNQYESIFSAFWPIMQKQALNYHKQLYQKFKSRVKYQPSRLMYEHDKKQYRELIRIKYESYKD